MAGNPGNGQVYSYQQIENLWIQNGGDPAAAPVAAAIAEAESGGNLGALNNNPGTGDYSVGLWQINYFGSLLDPRTAAYGSPQQLQGDPNAQARAAISVSNNGRDFTPWTTYTHQSYKQFLNGANSPAAGVNAVAGQPTSAAMGCATGQKGLNLGIGPLSVGTIGNACQLKALTGALLIGFGASVMILGGVLIFFGPRRAIQLARRAPGFTIGRQATAAASGTVSAPAEESGTVSAPVEGETADTFTQADLDDAFGEGVVAGQGSQSSARNARQGQREGERATDAAGLSAPGPGDRRTRREKLRAAA